MKIGIDVGSTGIKIVMIQDLEMVWKKVVQTRPGQSALVQDLVTEGLSACRIQQKDIEKICVTGYGRKLIDSPDTIVDEISANAAGIHLLSGGKARTLINIGGQDVKVIRLDERGAVTDFKMNDKCAAGTGRFFEIAATILDTPLDDFYSEDWVEPVSINSTCAVFAESEIVSLLAQDVPRQPIIQGINEAVARRIANLSGRSTMDEGVYVDGGPAMNRGLIESLEEALMCDVHVVDHPQFTVAYGSLFVE